MIYNIQLTRIEEQVDHRIANILEDKFLARFFSRIDEVAENIAERVQSCHVTL